jgi:glycerophosphoryl diester phosphodiesterase
MANAEAGGPWILGHRGVPRLAPENTLSSLRRALELGLEGVEYDLQGSCDGEAFLLHDDTLGRTTDGEGWARDLPWPQLALLDAGGWFGKPFREERLPLFEEALLLDEDARGGVPWHMVEIKDPELVPQVAQAIDQAPTELPVRVASFHRQVCLEARDRGLPTMLLGVWATEEDREFVRRERLDAHGVAAFGWRAPAGAARWSCERWAWSVDTPEDLLEACRTPLFGINTNEPLRALAIRRLIRLAPNDDGEYPLQAPDLEVEPDPDRPGGAWSGAWNVPVTLRNPFDWSVDYELSFAVRRGAFTLEGGPTQGRLAPGQRGAAQLRLEGGAWSPGLDPLLFAKLSWSAEDQRQAGVVEPCAGELELDRTLARRRSCVLRDGRQRLTCLNESPNSPPASLWVERRGTQLLLSIEAAGGLLDPQVLVHLDGRTVFGTRGLRLALPRDFDLRRGGVPFAAGIVGRPRGGGPAPCRRWCGGLPSDLLSGSPGRLAARRDQL